MPDKRFARPLTLLILLLLLAACGGKGEGAQKGRITVGSKDFTESILLGEMIAQLIERNTDIQVTRNLNLGSTKVLFNAIRRGAIDLYPEYDSTAWDVHLGHNQKPTQPAKLPDQVRQELEQKYGLTLSGSLGLDNRYALAVPEQLASQLELKTYTDLARVSKQLVFGTNGEFKSREVDGYYPLAKAYGFTFKNVKEMAPGARYEAVARNEIQAMDAYVTDGRLKGANLRLLQDDRSFFLPAQAAILVRKDSLAQNPSLSDLLNRLTGKISNEEMQELNYRVDVKGESAAAVAGDFLIRKGLIR